MVLIFCGAKIAFAVQFNAITVSSTTGITNRQYLQIKPKLFRDSRRNLIR